MTKRTLDHFFPDGIAVEMACELEHVNQCTTDMLSFKGYLHRFLAQTLQVAPYLRPTVLPVLKSSAAGMVKGCNPDGTCGFRWNTGTYDGNTGAGQEMNALGALLSLLIDEKEIPPPVTNATGGTSAGDAGAGGDPEETIELKPITGADRAGAGILTMLTLVMIVGAWGWMTSTFNEGPVRIDERGNLK